MQLITSILVFLFFFGAAFSTFHITQPQETESSSMAAANLYSYELNAYSAQLSDQMIEAELEEIDTQWRQESTNETTRKAFVLTPAQIAEDEAKLTAATEIPVEDVLLKYENTTSCSSARLSVEKIISQTDALKELREERPESTALPRQCLTYTMNVTNFKSASYGKCPGGLKSLPAAGGNKPCVSKNLVNTTYNSYIDVLQCFGFNPKNIMPKLFNESGFTINTLGKGFDAGVAQFTITGIELVNKEYNAYIEEVKQNAATNLACARLVKHLSLLAMASSQKAERCEFIYPVENPLRSFVYSAILNKQNYKEMKSRIETDKLEYRIKQLGFHNINIDNLTEALALAAYNAGLNPPYNALVNYVEKRERAGLRLSARDFDFYATATAADIDAVEKDVLSIARSFVIAPFTSPATTSGKALKIKRTKLLQQKIDSSYKLSFPEHLIYHQTNLSEIGGTITEEFRVLGSPGYINFLAKKNTQIRELFVANGKGADYCSNPDYLKMSR